MATDPLGTYACSLLLLIALFLKQMLAMRESSWLNVRLHQANTRLQALATSDPLTGLPNHRALVEALEREMARAHCSGYPLSVLFFDGDHFKRVNDTYGHGVGDAVLQELGSRGNAALRSSDLLGRFGGEEFLVLLPETDTVLACEVAERLRKEIAAYPLAREHVEGGIATTISIGVASFPADAHNASELRDRADEAMYWAKRLGRNQVRTAQEAERLKEDERLASTIDNLLRTEERSDKEPTQQMRDHQLNSIHALISLVDQCDHEGLPSSSEALITIAMSSRMVNILSPFYFSY